MRSSVIPNRRSKLEQEMRLRKCSLVHRRWRPGLPMPAEVDRTASSYAKTLAPGIPETEESVFVAALVRRAISKRASESKYPNRYPPGIDRQHGANSSWLYAAWIGGCGASDRIDTGDHLVCRSGFD